MRGKGIGGEEREVKGIGEGKGKGKGKWWRFGEGEAIVLRQGRVLGISM